jgi:phosphatidylglycerophosphate synthase
MVPPMTEVRSRNPERRPIAARKLRISHALAGWLARRGASPNGISIAGMLCGIAAGVALGATPSLSPFEQRLAWAGAAVLIQLRLLANMLDGMVALATGRASAVGELYNEVPDRVSDAAILIGAGYAVGGYQALGYWAACVALFTAYVRALGKGAGAPQEFGGPMAKQQRMFLVTLVALYCAFAPAAWQPRGKIPQDPGLMAIGLLVIIVGGVVTVLRRLARIAANLRKTSP